MRKTEKRKKNKKELEKESVVFPYDYHSVQFVIFISILHMCIMCNTVYNRN